MLGIPCFTLRDNTERPVTVTHGTNLVLGLDPGRLAEIPRRLLAPRRTTVPPLWDGLAGKRAAQEIENVLFEAQPKRVAVRESTGAAVEPCRSASAVRRSGSLRAGGGSAGLADRLVPLDGLAEPFGELIRGSKSSSRSAFDVSGIRWRTSWYLPGSDSYGTKLARSGSAGSPSSTWTRDASSRIVTVSVPPRLITSPRDSGRSSARDDAVGGVVHVRERPRLLAVAVDLHRLAVEERLDERDDRAAPPAEVVAGPVRVEQPEDRDAEVALVGEREAVVLVVHLRDRVRPALRRRRADHELAVLGVRRRAVSVHV